MNLLSGNSIKSFKLLSIGQRGVGKTVFLAGSYTEIHSQLPTQAKQQLWFDCQDSLEQEKIEEIINYIIHTGNYPPPTMKITNFGFSLKSHSSSGTQTVANFLWWDLPGEICESCNSDFRKMVIASHGCCVLIDAYALINDSTYIQAFEQIVEQVMAIASLVYLNELKYPFALVLTKCDLLASSPLNRQQLEKKLQPLTTRLERLGISYQTFYSFIPIVRQEGVSTLRAEGAAAPLLWLVWELSKAYKSGLMQNLFELISKTPSTDFQVQQEELQGSIQSVLKPTSEKSRVKKILNLYLLPTSRRHLLLLSLAIFSLASLVGFLAVNSESLFRSQPRNVALLSEVASLKQSGQFDKAVSLMEKLVEQEPKRLDLRLNLADLYELTGQVSKAETAYDQILAQEKDNISALIRKALLRKTLGDIETAQTLFTQAEKIAPTDDVRAQIRALAQKQFQAK